jgi:hypothetical protein
MLEGFGSFFNLLLDNCSLGGVKRRLLLLDEEVLDLFLDLEDLGASPRLIDKAIIDTLFDHAHGLRLLSRVLLNNLIFVVVESFYQILPILHRGLLPGGVFLVIRFLRAERLLVLV